jgi:hypothetical protein
MANRIDKIFDECVNRINSGESIESCLQRYPGDAPELSVLLQTYVNVRWRGSLVQPNPDFKARARLNLLYEQRLEAQKRYNSQPQKQRHPASFSFGRVWAPALAGLVVFLLVGSAGTAAAATGAMPDEPLYNVKLATEQVQLALAFSDTDKAIVNTQLAEKRSEEVEVMAAQGKTDQVIATTARMVTSLENAEAAINKLSETWAYTSGPQPVIPVTPTVPVPATKTTPAPTTSVKTTPSTGTSQSAATATTTPPASTASTDNTSQAGNAQVKALNEKTEKLRNTVNSSMNKNVTSLESALNKAPESAKSAIQKAIDLAKSKRDSYTSRFNSRSNSSRDSDNKSNSGTDSRSGSSGTPTTGNTAPTTTTPATTTPATGSGSGINPVTPTTTTPARTTPAPTTTTPPKTTTTSSTDNDTGNISIKSNTTVK